MPSFVQRTLHVLVVLTALTVPAAFADSYQLANFSGNFNGGSANVKAPFNSVVTQGGPISGSFVFDSQLIPGPLSGTVNVFFSSFSDIGSIAPPTAFSLNLGGGMNFD